MMGNLSIQTSATIFTFLFTDLEGSTRLWQQYPEEMKNALARHDELLKEAMKENNGKIVKATGDGFHVAFRSPMDGIKACIQAQKTLLEEPWEIPEHLNVRMGLHLGEAQQRAGDYYGTAVNRAARLMSTAHGGQVLLSSVMADLVADQLPEGVSLRNLGAHRLKDLQRPEHIFQLIHPELPNQFPAIESLNRLTNNLPIQPSSFIGRQKELKEIVHLLTDGTTRLLTLIGPGGTGKTRLALQSGAELIDRYPDGLFFVDLASIREPGAVMTTIARTIGLSESSNGSMLSDIKNQLQGKKMLLVLDNFEQVTSGAVHIADLLQFCPQIKILTTSREALRVRGERLYPVPPLGLPGKGSTHISPDAAAEYEAVQMFIERAKEIQPGFELNVENTQSIIELCIRLDGLPLAIELAAARIRLFSPESILQRLGSRFNLLRGGARDLPERQQTLMDTIAWSYDLLDLGEKRLFEVFSVFADSDIESVEAVLNSIGPLVDFDIDIIEGMSSLVDKSLIRMSANIERKDRLSMLESIKDFAAERIKADPELQQAAYQAHAVYFAKMAQAQWQRMTGHERETAMAEMTAEVDNLRLAWHHWIRERNLDQLQHMVNALWMLYDGQGWYQATVELTQDLLDVLSSVPFSQRQAQQEIMLQTSLARALMVIKGYTPEVEEAYTRALTLCEAHGEIPQLFPVLRGLSSYYMYRAEFGKGAQIGSRLLALAESSDDDHLRLHGYLVLGANTGFHSSYRDGLEILNKGIELFERNPYGVKPYQLGNNPGIVCYTSSAFFLWWLGFPDQALKRADRAMEMSKKLNHPFTLAYALFHTGNLYLWRGEMELARERAETILALAEKHGFQIWDSLGTMLLGTTQMALGQPEEGLTKIENGFMRYQGLKTPPVFFPQLIGMRAMAYAQAAQPARGLQLLDEFLTSISIESEEFRLGELSPLFLLRGELLFAVSPENTAEAAELFRTILAHENNVGGKIMTLQVATSLCKLEIHSGNIGNGCQILRETYESFTEGFDTVVLRDAKAVLDRLSKEDVFENPN